ncbi:hypothetical protein JCM10296v2_002830 [Rhodotorula toruloides]
MHVAGLLGALLAATAVTAAPSPKLPYFRGTRPRPAVQNFVSNVASAQYNLTDIPGKPTTKAPHANIWATLSNDEAAEVVSFLHNQTALNLTAASDAGSWDNQITVIDLAVPNKTETLNYLSGKGPKPPRMAYATIMFNSVEEPYVEDYLVGPLPVSANTTYHPYSFRTTKGTSKVRNYDADSDATYEFTVEAAKTCDDIVEDLLGAPTESWDIWGIDPLWHEDGRVISWVGFWGVPESVFDGETLLPQGLYMKFDFTGRDPNGWAFLGWLHNGIFYPTTADFRHAWSNGKVAKTTRNAGMNETWIGTDRDGAELPYDNRPPPIQIAPGGQRFAIDEDAQYVEWMDFSFYWSFRRDSGMRLWDIKYQNRTVLYELGLNEALAHYAGNDPVQSGTAYLDTWYGFGPYAFEAIEGYDCPTYAHYAPTTFFANEVATTHRKSICFFEDTESFPIQRHANGQYVAATKNVVFKMKSVSTVGNYDYSFVYSFMLDGSIGVEVMASGYIQSAYYAQNGEYGYRIHDGLSGSMHDHVLNWKADFDVLGTKNTFAMHTVEPKEVKYPWSNATRSTMHLVRNTLKNEDNATLHWPANGKSMYLVYNGEEKNKYGEERAWRIMPHIGGAGMHATIQNSSNLGPSLNFAKAPLYITKHHDSEFSSAHASNAYDPYNPVIDFAKYLNGENLEQEDLVLWFNLGMHHVPHTGDLGNTVHTTAHAGMIMSPHNYLLRDPSRRSSQMIRLNYNSSASDVVSEVLTFGGQQASGLFNLTAIQPDYKAYIGDSNVRKFPYDPQHPYNDTESIV